MKIKRFTAPDIRRAIRMVREELGEDAVILSNRNVDGNTEIVAAIDYDEELIREKLARDAAGRSAPGADTLTRPAGVPRQGLQVDPLQQGSATADEIAQSGNEMARTLCAETERTGSPAAITAGSDSAIFEMRDELRELRLLLDKRQSVDLPASGVPVALQGDSGERLRQAGFSEPVCAATLGRVDLARGPGDAWTQVKTGLADQIPVLQPSIMETGGIFVFVGPTGVGKTTTIAKLAARYRLKHGNAGVALITADNYRIAAHEQLNTYGRILDIPVRSAQDSAELDRVLNQFSDKRLILIDTAGMSQRDMRLAEQFRLFKSSERRIQSCLVMSAATQYEALKEIAGAFRNFEPTSGILTKFDEAVSFGAVVSTMIEHKLPISFVTNGQKVPEHLHEPTARAIVKHCFSLESPVQQCTSRAPAHSAAANVYAGLSA